MERVNAKTLREALVETVDTSAQIVSDDLSSYPIAAASFEGGHETVNHLKEEYVRKQFNNATGKVETITTNTAESFFALLKRGVSGTFHHVSKKHLHRNCVEFDFRWNGREQMDSERRDDAIRGAEGKRLTYKSPTGN